MEHSVPVLIVDDQAPFRRVAATLVALTPGFDVVGETETGEDGGALAAQLRPGLVLMDINLPGITGIEATAAITAAQPDTVVVLLSTYRADDLPAGALDSGAAAYVHKEDLEPAVLVDLWTRHGAPAT